MSFTCQSLFVLTFVVANNSKTIFGNVEGCGNPYDSRSVTGRSRRTNRIVNGTDVIVRETINNIPVHDYPWMVRITKRKYSVTDFCGGSLISTKHVLTAAHCMLNCKRKARCKVKDSCTRDEVLCKNNIMKWVILGDHDLDKDNNGEIYRKINRNLFHPKTNVPNPPDGEFHYDFSILELNQCISLKPNVQIVCLPQYDMRSYTGEQANVIGWGHQAFKDEKKNPLAGKYSPILKETSVRILSDDECAKKSKQYERDFMMCAGDPIKWEKDACQGDSGGPLLHQRKDTGAWEVLGIVSFGVGCAKLEHPGYYARVNQVVPWISNILSNGTNCQTERDISESSEDYQDIRSTECTYSNHSTTSISLSSISKSSNIITALSSFGFALVHVKFITKDIIQLD